ncbi:MAG: hypothetical protein VXY45_06425 [Pseudomonadota bacterium]|uniref:hypothetical protein n=1 Tax=Pseudooceanicola nitratireducens TaxID=517719 RepID=UPI001C94E32E|nr:hypothetical protein [Pseudooceanicola nitratireducens]MBY6164579.1 hypothetical protein [Pseudooceanicola nitratireducens]MEC7300563.1 hypothetical protein [Pseudomonadota bacterium]MEC8667457.1 hypothetical protein [Pseudomonadota bacterium]
MDMDLKARRATGALFSWAFGAAGGGIGGRWIARVSGAGRFTANSRILNLNVVGKAK